MPKDDIVNSLADMGFPLERCMDAIEHGCTSVEVALDYLINAQAPTLTLNSLNHASVPRDNDESVELPVVHSRFSKSTEAYKAIAEKQRLELKAQLVKDKKNKIELHKEILQSIQNDHKRHDESFNKPENSNKLQQIDVDRKIAVQQSQLYKKNYQSNLNAKLEIKKLIEEDKERRRKHLSCNKNVAATSSAKPNPSPLPKVCIRVRLDSFSQCYNFDPNDKFEMLISNIANITDREDFVFFQTFPLKKFSKSDHDKSFNELNLCGNVLLNLKFETESPKTEPINAPVPLVEAELSDERIADSPYHSDDNNEAINEDENVYSPTEEESSSSVGQRLGGAPEISNSLQLNQLRMLRFEADKRSARISNNVISLNASYSTPSLRVLTIKTVIQSKLWMFTCLPSLCAEEIIGHLCKNRQLSRKILVQFLSTDLTKLVLDFYPLLTNDLLNAVGLFSNLTNLSIQGGELINDEGIDELKNLTKLTCVNLSGCRRIVHAFPEFLNRLSNLRSLNLNGTRFSDESISRLCTVFTNLSILLLSSSMLTDRYLQLFPRLFPILNTLDLSKTSIRSINSLEGLTELQSLNVSSTMIDINGIVPLTKMLSLRVLDLSGTLVENGAFGVRLLQPLSLHVLKLPHRRSISDDCIKCLIEMPLVELDFNGCSLISSASFLFLSKMKTLHLLSLANTGISDVSLYKLSELENLQELTLDNTHITDEGALQLSFPNLNSLSLTGTKISNSFLLCQSLESRFPSLIKLNLSRTDLDRDVISMLRHSKMEMLSLEHSNISADYEFRIRSNIPSLKLLRI